MVDTYPVDFTTPVGKVRKYIPDLVQIPDENDNTVKTFLFSDDEIQSFLDDETSSNVLPLTSFRIRRAAAWAMIALANNENLILKKIVTQDQQTDGPSVAKQLIAAAAALFAQADAEETAINNAPPVEGFSIVTNPFYDADSLYELRWLR